MAEFTFINLLLVLLAAWTMGALAQRLGFPALLGELLAGIVFGPALLGWLQPDVGIQVLSEVGVFLMMLYIGMEINVSELRKSGVAAVIASVGGFVAPLAAVMVSVRLFDYDWQTSFLVGTAAAVTSLAVGSRLLVDLKLMTTRLATVLTAGALLSDTLTLVLFTGATGTAQGGGVDMQTIMLMSGKIVLFFVGVVAFGLLVLPRLSTGLKRIGFEGRTAHFTIVLLVALCYAELAELAGLHAILGAFLAGLFLGERFVGFRQSHELREMVRDLSVGFLAPIFFVQSGFEVSFSALQANFLMPTVLVLVAFSAKFIGTALAYLPSGNGWREATALGIGMNGRGALDLVIAGIALESGLIDRTIFSSLVVLAILSASVVPLLLRLVIRNINRHGGLVESETRSGTMIVGASPTALALAEHIGKYERVQIIDSNTTRCERAKQRGLKVYCGNALEETAMQEASAGSINTLIALTPNPQINLFAAQLARETFHVPNVFAQVAGEVRRRSEALIDNMEIGMMNLGAFDLPEWDRWVASGRARPETIPVRSPITTEYFLDTIYTKHPFLPCVIVRGEQAIFYFASDGKLQPGDQVVGLRLHQADPQYDQFDDMIDHAHVFDFAEALSYERCFELVAKDLGTAVDYAADDIVAGLIDRERADSTVLNSLLAVPHVLIPGRQKFAMAIVRAKQGVHMYRPSNDGEQESAITVKALFITVGTRDTRNMHLRLLSTIAQIVQNKDFERGWMDAESNEALRAFLHDVHRRGAQPTFF